MSGYPLPAAAERLGIRRFAWLLGAALALSAVLPQAALAVPREESCASLRAVPFSAPVPASMRTVGTHGFEWYSTFVDADGNLQEGTAENSITIDPTAPAYPNTVLLRLVRNTTLLSDGSVEVIDTMRPDQAATFYAAAFSTPDDTAFLDSFRTWLRYETSPGLWTDFVELRRGPVTNFCSQVTTAAWKKTYGWD